MRLARAVEDLGVEREPLAQLGEKDGRVLGVADGARRDRDHLLGAKLLVDGDVLADGGTDILDRFAGQLGGGVDPATEAGHGRAPLDLGHVPALDIGDQQPGRVGPHVDNSHSHRRRIVGARRRTSRDPNGNSRSGLGHTMCVESLRRDAGRLVTLTVAVLAFALFGAASVATPSRPRRPKEPILAAATYPDMTTYSCRTDAITIYPGQNINLFG